MAVDRCICMNLTFRELLEEARRRGLGEDVRALSDLTGAGTSCGTCVPYLQIVLKTGHTNLPVLSDSQFKELLRRLNAQA